jgi:hypothetical protein
VTLSFNIEVHVIDLREKKEPFFVPFAPLRNSTHSYQALLRQMTMSFSVGDYDKATKITVILIELCLEGIRYYQTYVASLVIGACMILGMTGFFSAQSLQWATWVGYYSVLSLLWSPFSFLGVGGVQASYSTSTQSWYVCQYALDDRLT